MWFIPQLDPLPLGVSWVISIVLATGLIRTSCTFDSTIPLLVSLGLTLHILTTLHVNYSIPSRTCVSPPLFESFADLSQVRPSRDRRILATFAGSMWGTGFMNRARLWCDRDGWRGGGQRTHRLHEHGPILTSRWGYQGDYSYTALLNDTIFCPQPAGTTGGH